VYRVIGKIILVSSLAVLSVSQSALGDEIPDRQQKWGIGFVGRYASVPYFGDSSSVSDVTPMLYYEGKYLYLNGLEYGLKVYDDSRYRASLITKLRYVDMPKSKQNSYLEDPVDAGVELRYKLDSSSFVDFAVMNDLSDRYYGYVEYSVLSQAGGFEYTPYVQIRWSDAKFGKFYYGNNIDSVGAGLDAAVGVDGKYHLVSNLYLLGGAEARYLGNHAKNSDFADKDYEGSVYLGIGMMNDAFDFGDLSLSTTPYVKLEYGWATPSDLAEILSGKSKSDANDNQLTSIFYGHPLSNTLFGLPIDMYLTPGITHHYDSSVQGGSTEYIMAIKGYYTIPTKWRIRLGVAEGVSYVDNVPYIESHEMDEKGYKSSKLMNYANFTVDINLGDIFSQKLENVWLGAGVHHRSSIFESSSMFGRIKGGSNYNSVYLQYHF